MIGEPVVPSVEKTHCAGKFGREIQRPGPPNLARQINDRFRAAENPPFGRGDAHFAEQFPLRQIEKGLDARVLQSSEAEAAGLECAAETPGERSADAAVAVKANPAAGGASAFTVSYF